MKHTKHATLRTFLRRYGISYEDAAFELGLSVQGLVAKLDSRVPWKLVEVYKLSELLEKHGCNWDRTDGWLSLWPREEQIYTSRRN